MKAERIQEIYQRFSAPLASFIALGGRKEAAEELARNLWMAFLAGEEFEQGIWEAMEMESSELCSTVRTCYEEEMKPAVTEKELTALRKHYQI